MLQTRHTVCAPTWTSIGSESAGSGVCSSHVVTSIQAGTQQKLLSRSCLLAVPGSTDGMLIRLSLKFFQYED